MFDQPLRMPITEAARARGGGARGGGARATATVRATARVRGGL